MGDDRPTWLRSAHVETYCIHAKVDYEEYCTAIEYMVGKSEVQRKFLLAKLKKSLNLKKRKRGGRSLPSLG